jgi:diguanylate cyclase (GGDEF)-like protein
MVTKSVPAERRDEKSGAEQAEKSRTDSRAANPCLVNENSVTSMTWETKQTLIKILICDDNQADRELIYSTPQRLTDIEVVLLEAVYTEEVRNALDKGRIDLVLMGEQMSGKAGMSWLAQITERQLAPVVMLTDARIEEMEAQVFQEGTVDYLPRSGLSPEKLLSIIDIALDKWARLQQAMADKEKLERLANFDSLTGIYNQRAILGKLAELLNLANRYREDFSLIMMDIDHFKKVNDCYGHLTGDEALEKIAALIRGNIRNTDVAGRYGGEEFMIILPKTNLSLAWVVAERLRTIIEKAELKDATGNAFAMTVSQGLVGWERNDDAVSLISRADEALYKAKKKGQNRVQILLGPSLRDKI